MRQEQVDLLYRKVHSSCLENKEYLSILHNNSYEHQYFYRVAARLKDDVYPLLSLNLTCLTRIILPALILLGWYQTQKPSLSNMPCNG